MARVFVRRPSGNFVEARYADVTLPSITLHEALTARRTLLAKGRREVDSRAVVRTATAQRPRDVAEVDGANWPNQRLEGDEPDGRRRLAEMVDTAHDIRVFNAGAEPDIWKDVAHLRGNERRHSFGSLGKNLINVARGLAHDPPDTEDEFVADTLMK